MIERQHLPFGLGGGFFVLLWGFFFVCFLFSGFFVWIKEMTSAHFALEWLP